MPAEVGPKVLDFVLKDQDGNEVRLPAFLERRGFCLSILWTGPVCADQMKALERNFEEFKKLDVVPRGLSIDTVPLKKA